MTQAINPQINDLLFIGEERLRQLLSMSEAIDVLEETLKGTIPTAPVRQHLTTDNGELLLMPAWGNPGTGVKLVAVRPDNRERGLPFIQGVFVMFAREDSRPIGLIDGAALTALRTAAVSGLGARHLSREDASRLVIFGTGRQAKAHLEAMMAVRPVKSVVAVNPRNPNSAATFVDWASSFDIEARAGRPDEVAEADLICTCTTSLDPVFDGDLIAPGSHVAAMGAYRADMRELDGTTMKRASVYVESREAALAEAGDLVIAASRDDWSADLIAGEIEEVVRGQAGRTGPEEITVFKSVGIAWQDLVVAAAAFQSLGGGEVTEGGFHVD